MDPATLAPSPPGFSPGPAGSANPPPPPGFEPEQAAAPVSQIPPPPPGFEPESLNVAAPAFQPANPPPPGFVLEGKAPSEAELNVLGPSAGVQPLPITTGPTNDLQPLPSPEATATDQSRGFAANISLKDLREAPKHGAAAGLIKWALGNTDAEQLRKKRAIGMDVDPLERALNDELEQIYQEKGPDSEVYRQLSDARTQYLKGQLDPKTSWTDIWNGISDDPGAFSAEMIKSLAADPELLVGFTAKFGASAKAAAEAVGVGARMAKAAQVAGDIAGAATGGAAVMAPISVGMQLGETGTVSGERVAHEMGTGAQLGAVVGLAGAGVGAAKAAVRARRGRAETPPPPEGFVPETPIETKAADVAPSVPVEVPPVEGKPLAKPSVSPELKAEEAQKLPPTERTLPEDPWRYFKKTENTQLLPTSKDVLEAAPRSGGRTESAFEHMDKARIGEGPVRDPILVRETPEGRYQVVDGNTTLSVAREQGWKEIPVEITKLSDRQLAIRAHPAIKKLADSSALKLRNLYREAFDKKPEFDKALKEVAAEVNGEPITPGVKSPERAVHKIQSDYEGDAGRIKDLLRGTINVKTVADAQLAYDRLRQKFKTVGKDRVLLDESVDPVDGYRDIKVNVDMGGYVGELQINFPELYKIKEGKAHPLYVERENIYRNAMHRDLTASELARVAELNAGMRRLYYPAWEAIKAVRKSETDTGVPLRSTDSGGKILGTEPSQAAQSIPGTPQLTETGIPSTSKSSQPGGILPKKAGSIEPLAKGKEPVKLIISEPRQETRATPSGEKLTGSDILAQATLEADRAASPSGLYSNPLAPMLTGIARAMQKLRDVAGIKTKDTTIVPTGKELAPGLLSPFQSPSILAHEYPVLARYLDLGQKAGDVQERLRNTFGRRMHAVEVALGRRGINIFNKTFKENKTRLWNLMIEEDARGARMTEEELRDVGTNDRVVSAHLLMRSAYDHALGVANSARAARGKEAVSRREGYVPHFFHNYFIAVDGEIQASAKSLREAVSMSNDAARTGKKIRIIPKTFKFEGEGVQAAVLGDIEYFKMQGKLEKNFGLDHAEAKDMLDQLARQRGRSRFVGNFLERKGVKGWEKDLDWVHRHYFNMVSRYAALDHFKSKTISAFERDFGSFDKNQRGIGQYIKNYINDVNGVPTHIEDLINSSVAKVPALGKFLGAYFGERPALQLVSATTKSVAIAKLGLYNLSSALVNAVQGVNTYALLGARWTGHGMRRWAAIEKTLTDRRLGLDSAAKRDLGLLRKMGIDVAMGLEAGAGYSKAGMGKLFNASTVFFQGVERFNRVAAALGGYYKFVDEGRTHAEALAYGKDVAQRTQFDYSVADAPSFIRQSGPVGQLLFQFKKYPVKQLEFMASLKGAQNARFWIPFFLLSGYYGLPGASLLNNTVRDTFGLDMELELKKYLMEWAGTDKNKQAVATTILRGAFGNVGVDITRRVGAGDIVPNQLSDFFGPGISSVVRASQMAAQGDWVETLRAISTAPGNLARAIANNGELTDPNNRERSIIKLTPKERVISGLGFTPERVSLESDTARLIRYETQKVSQSRKEIIDAVIEAAKLADAGDTKKADARAKRAMDRAEKMGIGFTAKQLETEIGQKNLTRAQRAWISASPEIKARMAGVMEFHESRQ